MPVRNDMEEIPEEKRSMNLESTAPQTTVGGTEETAEKIKQLSKELLKVMVIRFIEELYIENEHYKLLEAEDRVALDSFIHMQAARKLKRARRDARDKQIVSAAIKRIEEKSKKYLGVSSRNNTFRQRFVYLFQGVSGETHEIFDKMVSYNHGVSKKWIEIVTLNGRSPYLLREILRTIESEDALETYKKKIREQIKRTFSKEDPLKPVLKKRTPGKVMNLAAYTTIPKLPITVEEFKLNSKETAERIRTLSKAAGIPEEMYTNTKDCDDFWKIVETPEYRNRPIYTLNQLDALLKGKGPVKSAREINRTGREELILLRTGRKPQRRFMPVRKMNLNQKVKEVKRTAGNKQRQEKRQAGKK